MATHFESVQSSWTIREDAEALQCVESDARLVRVIETDWKLDIQLRIVVPELRRSPQSKELFYADRNHQHIRKSAQLGGGFR